MVILFIGYHKDAKIWALERGLSAREFNDEVILAMYPERLLGCKAPIEVIHGYTGNGPWSPRWSTSYHRVAEINWLAGYDRDGVKKLV